MPTILESYLSEVAKYLCALPLKRREEELREIRQHLHNAAAVNQEFGQSEEAAAANAVVQFGTAQDLGGNLVWAWKRERKLDKRSFWGAAACSSAILILVPYIFITFIIKPFEPINSTNSADWAVVRWLLFGSNLAYPVVAGLVSGVFFSKRAIAGTALGSMFYLICCVDASCHMNHTWQRFEEVRSGLWFAAESLMAPCFAWAGSQWRRGMKQSRLARG